jgi:predicted XRE-type DNA-binding protein
MNDELELIRGSGNVYRDLGRANASLEQARALAAAKIISFLDARQLSIHDAEKITGVSHAEFSRIRNAELHNFTLDRMIVILSNLDADLEISMTFVTRSTAHVHNALR